MSRIFQAESQEDFRQVRLLFAEYLAWVHGWFVAELGVDFDVQARVEEELAGLARYRPPGGRILLLTVGSELGGMVCLRDLGGGRAELKRMYVRAAYRGRGLGRALLDRLTREARDAGYRQLRLDSADILTEALALYRSAGFRAIEAYAGCEIPETLHDRWVFLEKDLA